MFCEKCGAQVDNDSKFCLNCGTPVTPQEPTAAPTAPKAPGFFSNKKNVLIVSIIAAVVVLGIVAAIVISGLPTSIYMDDYITIEYDGLSTKGTAYLRVNSEALQTALLQEMTEQEMYTMMARMGDPVLELDKTEALTNGDEIHITFFMNNDIAKEYGVQFKLKKDTVKVEALQEPIFLDLFADIKLVYTGCSPYSKVEIEKTSTNEFITEHVYYYIDNSYDLEEGEAFTVEASFSEYEAEEAGYIVLESSKEYTATNLPQPIELNPFDYVEVTFSGLEEKGKADFEKIGEIDFMDYISFEFNKSSNLKEGDTIALIYEIRYSADPLQYGYKLVGETSKQYTVPKLGSYLTDFSALSSSAQEKIINKATEIAKLYLTKESEENRTSNMYLALSGFNSSTNKISNASGLSNVKLHSVITAKPGKYYDYQNLYFVFSVDITGHTNIEGGNGTGYIFMSLSRPIVSGEGILEVNYDSDYVFTVDNSVYLSYEELSTKEYTIKNLYESKTYTPS